MKMKKIVAVLAALCMAVALFAGCSSNNNSNNTVKDSATPAPAAPATTAPAVDEVNGGEPVELTVFAAASMTETLDQLAEVYKEAHPNVTINFNYDSSGTLKTQIEEGAVCDLFISAAPKQMNELDITADPEVNVDGLDFVQSDTRIDLLENKVALAVTDENAANIKSYDDLAEALKAGTVKLAIGNADVPVGQYTQKIFEYYGLNEEELASAGVLSYGTNVKEVTTQVAEGTVDCGIIYATDAFSANLAAVDFATAEMCGQVIYPAAVMKNSEHQDVAVSFLNFLTSAEASEVFESVGFTPLAK